MATTEPRRTSLNLEEARTLLSNLEANNINLLNARKAFIDSTSGEGQADESIGWASVLPGGMNRDPSGAKDDVEAMMRYFRRVKFEYLQKLAKDRYIKLILSDEAPMITSEDNAALQAENERAKEALRERKRALDGLRAQVRAEAAELASSYERAQRETQEAAELSQKILDARLALTRLRQTHPAPRLTIDKANDVLEEQEAEMQRLDEELDTLTQTCEERRGVLHASASELERVRATRAEKERAAHEALGARAGGAHDARVMALFDWYAAGLDVHRALAALEYKEHVSDDELQLIYGVAHPERPEVRRRVTIALVYRPGGHPRRLEDAQVDVDGQAEPALDALLDEHVRANDVRGLVRAVLRRVREDM